MAVVVHGDARGRRAEFQYVRPGRSALQGLQIVPGRLVAAGVERPHGDAMDYGLRLGALSRRIRNYGLSPPYRRGRGYQRVILHHAGRTHLQYRALLGPPGFGLFPRDLREVLPFVAVLAALPTTASTLPKTAETPPLTFFPATPPMEPPAITPAASVNAWERASPATANIIETPIKTRRITVLRL